jgi:hypothetical protein
MQRGFDAPIGKVGGTFEIDRSTAKGQEDPKKCIQSPWAAKYLNRRLIEGVVPFAHIPEI